MPRRDVRPFLYAGIDQLFVVIYAYVIAKAIPNRLPSGAAHLWALPVLMQVIALGTAARALPAPRLRRAGWWTAVIGCTLLVAVTIALIVRVLISAAFLAGVYGAFGKAAAMSALLGVALAIELVGLLPLFQVKFLMTRAGRRAYAMRVA